MTKILRAGLAVLVVLAAGSTLASTAQIKDTAINKLLVSDGQTFGGCLIALSKSPSNYLGSCGNTWVTFSCTGDHTSISGANRMLEMAKMAFALEKTVTLRIDDNRTHDGYCYAYDIRF